MHKKSGQNLGSPMPSAGGSRREATPTRVRWEIPVEKNLNCLYLSKRKATKVAMSALQLRRLVVSCQQPQWLSPWMQKGNLSSCRKATFQLLWNVTWLELTAFCRRACSFSVTSYLNKFGKNVSFNLSTSRLIRYSVFYYMLACSCENYSSNSIAYQSWAATHFLHQLAPSH